MANFKAPEVSAAARRSFPEPADHLHLFKISLNFQTLQWVAEPRQAASLQAIDGSDTQDVGQHSHYVFGRDPAESTILIDDPSISRRHSAICHHKDGRIYIIDLASVRLK